MQISVMGMICLGTVRQYFQPKTSNGNIDNIIETYYYISTYGLSIDDVKNLLCDGVQTVPEINCTNKDG